MVGEEWAIRAGSPRRACEQKLLVAARRPLVPLGVLVVAVLAIVMGVTLGRRAPWEKYQWEASSAEYGLGRTGTLGGPGIKDLLFHTSEEQDPWVVIDLLKSRRVRRIILRNCVDCCRECGFPLVVETAGEDRKFVELERRVTVFDDWTISFAPQTVRYVRLRAEGTTVLHMRKVEIR